MSSVPMTCPDMMLVSHDETHSTNHTILDLGDGRILRLVAGWKFVTSEDGGLTWSDPIEHTDPDGEKIGGSGICLARLDGEGIGVAAIERTQVRTRNKIRFWRSPDGGKTWDRPVRSNPPLVSAHTFANRIMRTSNGRLIHPLYFCIGQGGTHKGGTPFPGGLVAGQWVTTDAHYFDPHFAGSYVVYSDDDGRTWQPNKDGELFIHVDEHLSAGAAEPCVVEVQPNKLLMFVRTQLGRLFQAWSYDNGESWTRLHPTALASSASPATLLKVPDTGHLICVWNQHSEDEVKGGFIRTRLSSAVSRNGGGIWEFFQNIESIHEEEHVFPGPIRHTRPQQVYTFSESPAVECPTEYCHDLPVGYGRFSNATATLCGDRVLVNYSSLYFDEQGDEHNRACNRLKVLPLEWFYGGRDRFKESFVLNKISSLSDTK